MNRDRAVPGPGGEGVQAVISRERAVAGPVADAVQSVMSRDRAPDGDGIQTVVGPDSGDGLDGVAAGEKRLFSNAVAGGRDVQAGENHSEPAPTNPVLVPPPQVDAWINVWGVGVGGGVTSDKHTDSRDSTCQKLNVIKSRRKLLIVE